MFVEDRLFEVVGEFVAPSLDRLANDIAATLQRFSWCDGGIGFSGGNSNVGFDEREPIAVQVTFGTIGRFENFSYACSKDWFGCDEEGTVGTQLCCIALHLFLRTGKDKKKGIVCVCNFTPVTYEGFVFGLPAPGTLKEILNSDDEQFGGTGVKNPPLIHAHKQSFLGMNYSASITLPPMSAVFFRYKPRKK